MPVVRIDRLEDSRLDPFRDLKARRDSGQFVVEGLTVTERLLASGFETLALVAEERFAQRLETQLPAQAPLYVVPRQLIPQLAGFHFHRGVLACGRRPVCPRLDTILPPPPARVAVAACIGIQDPENLGGIVRSSAALGVATVLVGPGCADPYSRRVARTSMGAIFQVPIVQSDDLYSHLLALRRTHAVRLVGTALAAGARCLSQVAKPDRVALLFGSEGFGLERRWLELCEDLVRIPMQPGVDSLNASVAAGIFLYSYSACGRVAD